MHRLAVVVGAAILLLSTQLVGVANAQETPVCGPPGEEVPATIVGAGVINGAGGGNDIVCGEGGNDVLNGAMGNDVLIGDQLDSFPADPSNGANNDTLNG